MKLKIVAAVCAAVLLASCQTAQPLATASGKPEIMIHAPPSKIKAILIARAMNQNLSVTRDSEFVLQLERPAKNVGTAILFGSRYDAMPNERYVATFAPMGEETRVVISSMVVTNPGSGFEQITPINVGEAMNVTQRTLEEVKRLAETPEVPTIAATQPKKPHRTTPAT